MHRVVLSLVGATLALSGAPAGAQQQPLELREWEVPWPNTRPRDPYVAPDGKVWFVGQQGHYIASFDPTNEQFRKFDLEPGTGPHNLIVDQDGMVWYAGNRAAHIGKVDPRTGAITKYPMPDPAARDPHTLVFAPDGNIWFTLQGANMIGHLVTSTGEVHLLSVPTPRARPYGIKVDASGRPWIVLLGTNKLATVDPRTMELTEIVIPRESARPRRLEIVGGKLWIADYGAGYLVSYDPQNRTFEEWRMPAGPDSEPYGTAADSSGVVWLVEGGVNPNMFVGFDTRTKRFVRATALGEGRGTVRHMVYHRPTGTVWFGTDRETIGRAKVE